MSENSPSITIVINGREELSYDRCPVPGMKRNIIEMLFESTLGASAKGVSEEDLADGRVLVTDFSGNKMPASLQDIWDSIGSYFDQDQPERPWCIDDAGRMVICKPGTKRSRTADCTQQKTRQPADSAVKVRQ